MRLAIDASDGRFTISRRYLVTILAVARGGAVARQSGRRRRCYRGSICPSAKVDIDGPAHYLLTSRVGLDYGPAYRAVSGCVDRR